MFLVRSNGLGCLCVVRLCSGAVGRRLLLTPMLGRNQEQGSLNAKLKSTRYAPASRGALPMFTDLELPTRSSLGRSETISNTRTVSTQHDFSSLCTCVNKNPDNRYRDWWKNLVTKFPLTTI